MKNLFFCIFVLFFNFSFSQTNVGFAKAAGLEEGVACSSVSEAIDRFIAEASNPLLGPRLAKNISQAYKNANKFYGGRQDLDPKDIKIILNWIKGHPEDASDYGFNIYRLPDGKYVFQTLSGVEGKWVDGKQISRQAHKDEYALEVWGQKMCSSWCLNDFATVGEVEEVKTKTIYIHDTVRVEKTVIVEKVIEKFYEEPVIDTRIRVGGSVRSYAVEPSYSYSGWGSCPPPAPVFAGKNPFTGDWDWYGPSLPSRHRRHR